MDENTAVLRSWCAWGVSRRDAAVCMLVFPISQLSGRCLAEASVL